MEDMPPGAIRVPGMISMNSTGVQDDDLTTAEADSSTSHIDETIAENSIRSLLLFGFGQRSLCSMALRVEALLVSFYSTCMTIIHTVYGPAGIPIDLKLNREASFELLVSSQNDIGWSHLLRGRFSHHWGQIQQDHIYRRLDRRVFIFNCSRFSAVTIPITII
jgi:hypothetical protein